MSTIVIFFYRFIKYKTLFILVFLFKFNIASSQINDIYNQYIIQHFNTDNGLPTNQVWHSCMGTDGRIYLATDDGVVIYDGIFFKQLGLKDGMKSQSVYGVFQLFDYIVSNSFKGQDFFLGNKIIKNTQLNELEKIQKNSIMLNIGVLNNTFFQSTTEKLYVIKKKNSNNFDIKIEYIKDQKSNDFLVKLKRYILKNNDLTFQFLDDFLIGFNYKKSTKAYIWDYRRNLEKTIELGDTTDYIFLENDKIYIKSNELLSFIDLRYNYKHKVFLNKNLNTFFSKEGNLFASTSEGYYTLMKKNNWISTHKDSIFHDRQKEDLKKLNINIKNYYIENDKKWIGTGSGVLIFKYNQLDTILLKDIRISSIIPGKNSTKWLSTSNGIFQIDSNYRIHKYSSKLFRNAKINSIAFEKDSLLWISTEGIGIFMYNINTKILKTISLGYFQISNNFSKILIDYKNRKWLLSEQGMVVLDKNIKKIYRKQEGLQSNSIKHIEFRGDTIITYNSKGIDVFLYTSGIISKKIPLIFNEFKILQKTTESIPAILDPKENKITLQMVGIYYPSPKDIIYRYQLIRNGTKSKWKWYFSNNLNFDELNFGKYVLQIQAINKFNPNINSEIKKFQFEIEPFWYQRPIVWILFSILLVSITALGLFQSYKRRQNRIMKKIATESKLNLYRLNGLQNQMNPHFVFNSLNTLQYLIASKEEDKTNQYLVNFSLLMREMLDQSRHLEISLEDEIRFLKKYISLEKIRFSDTFDCKWKNSIEEEEWSEIFIPNMLIQPLIENAIKYGIPNCNEDAKFIEIKIDLLETNILEVKIIDHGKWIERTSLTGKAHSLIITKERVELYEKNGAKGNLDILKKSTSTEVKLNIPI
jgi:ligand-binding sensor domain-containing protein